MSSAALPLFGDGMVIMCADVIEHVRRAYDATMHLTMILALYGRDLDKVEDVLIDRPDVPMRSNRLRERARARVGRDLRWLSR